MKLNIQVPKSPPINIIFEFLVNLGTHSLSNNQGGISDRGIQIPAQHPFPKNWGHFPAQLENVLPLSGEAVTSPGRSYTPGIARVAFFIPNNRALLSAGPRGKPWPSHPQDPGRG